MKSNNYLLNKFFKMYIPVCIVCVAAYSINQVVDSFVASNVIGSTALAAMGIASPISAVVAVFSGILGGGGLLLCTKYIGEGQKEKVNALFTYIVITGLVLAQILTLICGLMPETVASLLGANAELVHEAGIYIQSYSYGVIATFMNFMLMNFVRLDGADSLPLVATLLGTVGNIIMDIVFCKYFQWGVFGLALATSLTGFISFAVVMTYFLKKDRMLHLSKMYDVINIKDVADVLKLGSPEALNTFCQVARAIMLNYVLVGIGSTMAMNSYAIQDTVNSIVCAVPVGIAAALNFNVGLYYGEKDGNAVKKTLKAAIKIAVACSVVLLVLIVILSQTIVNLFGTGTEEAVTAVRFLGIVLLFRSLSEVFVKYFQSVHKVGMSLYIGFAHHVLFMFISLRIFPPLFGLKGVWIAMIFAEALAVISVIIISLIKSKGDFSESKLFMIPKEIDYLPLVDISVENDDEMFDKAYEIVKANAGKRELECFSRIAGYLLSNGYKGGKHFFDVSITKIDEGMILRIRDDAEKYNPKEVIMNGNAEDDFNICDDCIDYHYTMRINTTSINYDPI